MNAVPVGGSRDRVGLVAAGNPNVLHNAADSKPKDGPAWKAGLRAGTKAGKTKIDSTDLD